MKKNAFTLIELIATIGLLGMLATITITISVRKINETKEKARDTMIESIELAAKQYVTDKGSEILEFNNNDNAYITLQTLVEKEYFTESLIDPTTKKSLPLTNEVYVTREENGEITSTYNINQRKEPKLTLIGSYNEYVEEGNEYVEKGVIALSPTKEDVSDKVLITGTVNTTIPNTYKITYELENIKITRNVIVFSKNISSEEFYKFTVNLDGGIDNIEYEKKYKAGSTIILEEPTKEGYNFAGWTIISGTAASLNGNLITIGNNTLNIKAIWKKIVPINFSTDSWSTIVAAVKSGNHPYEVGNTKTVDMGSLGTHTIRVSNTTPCDGTLESETACGFVLEFADIITKHNMNPAGEYYGKQYDSGTNLGGWPASDMRTYVNSDIYNALPEELRNGIINTYVVSSYGSNKTTGVVENENAGVLESELYWSNDKLYLLSPQEVYGTSFTSQYDKSNGTSRQLDYYATYQGDGYIGVSTVKYEGAIKQIAVSDSWWWLRSARSNGSSGFYSVSSGGDWGDRSSYTSRGVAPAFRLAD